MTEKKSKAKIGHSLDELEDGLILTLQDKPVLLNGQINQDDDVFENVQKRQLNEAQHNRQLKQKLKLISNAATSHLQAKNEGIKDLLPHYNDHRYKSDEVDIEEGTIIKRSKPKQKKNVASDFESTQQVNTEYYQRTTKLNKRKKDKTSTTDLLSFLNETAVQKDMNQNNQLQSVDVLIQDSLDVIRKRRKIQNQEINGVGINQDEEFLAKAIKLGRSKNTEQRLNVLSIIRQEQMDEEAPSDLKYTEIEMNPVTYKPTNSKIEVKKTFNITDAARGTASCLFVNLPSEKISIQNQEVLPESFDNITPEALQRMKKQISFLQQKQAGIGLSGTLQFLREHNLLNKEEQFGRTNDKKSNHNEAGDRIKLEYRNASGKLMKPKQAFRYLSAIFHGQGPSQNTIEKIKKKDLLEMRMKQATNQPSKMLTLLEKHQKQTGQAHMVIQLGSKQKQTQ